MCSPAFGGGETNGTRPRKRLRAEQKKPRPTKVSKGILNKKEAKVAKVQVFLPTDALPRVLARDCSTRQAERAVNRDRQNS